MIGGKAPLDSRYPYIIYTYNFLKDTRKQIRNNDSDQ